MLKMGEHNLQDLLDKVEFFRLDASRRLDPARRAELGQFLTPPAIARLMASMFEVRGSSVRLLDAGAGVGTLTAAWVAEVCGRDQPPSEISVTAYEVDDALIGYLTHTLEACRTECEAVGIKFTGQAIQADFIEASVPILRGSMFAPALQRFDCAILNPPYRKINSDSRTRHLLRAVGVETSNLYTAFLSLVIGLLEEGGQLVTITPRSFCNGLYFRPFRKSFLHAMTVRQIHVFDSRDLAFGDDEVLQENVIFDSVKGADKGKVMISSSLGPDDEVITAREVGYGQLVEPNDPDAFIRIVSDDAGRQVAERMKNLAGSLGELGITVSTGRVVEFRSRKLLTNEPTEGAAPLIHPAHFANGFVQWPKLRGKKPNAIAVTPRNDDQLVPADYYVLVKRFSSKEERRRVVAAVFDPGRVPADKVAFENHLNYYHRGGRGLPVRLAKGLAAFLNSTLVDWYFRQFSGHTQVNATDLRSLRYPDAEQLESLGRRIGDVFPEQDELDQLVEEELQMRDAPKHMIHFNIA